jgi:outer membrane protein TolC
LFKDPVLQSLIKEALNNNYDVMTAAARVEQSRAQAGIARSIYSPQVGYGAGVGGERSPLAANHTYYSYNFNLDWELDLWVGHVGSMNSKERYSSRPKMFNAAFG